MTRQSGSLALSVFVALVILASLTPPSLSDIPKIISYQGKVTDAGGTPVADGDYSMTFTIYDAPTGGTSLWSSGAMTVAADVGIFSVLLGESPQPSLGLAFDEDYWLKVMVGSDLQCPCSRLGSVGHAYMASGLVPGTAVTGAVDTGTNAVITGMNTATTAAAYGIVGVTVSTYMAAGVYGGSTASAGIVYGGYFQSQSTSGVGILGHAAASTGENYGVYGTSSSPTGYAVYG
jgi:hypothetical protein